MAYTGMTPEQFQVLLAGLKTTYPSKWFIPSQEAANIWYRTLKDLPYEALNLGVTKWIMTSSEEPKIADIRKSAMEFMPHEAPELNEQEAAALISKAVSASGWHAQEEYDKLPAVLQKAVGCPENLEEWSQMDANSFKSVQMSQILRNLRVVQKREAEEALLSPAVQKRLQIAMSVAKGEKIEDKHTEDKNTDLDTVQEEEVGMSADTKAAFDDLMKGWGG